MSYDWQKRSDCKQSYDSALHFSFTILHLYMQQHASLHAAAAAADQISLQATKDTVILLAEPGRRSKPYLTRVCVQGVC